MKKLLLIFLLLICVSSIFAKEYTLKNGQISINIDYDKEHFYVNQISDGNVEYITETNNISIWELKVKKDKEFNSEEIILKPENAKAFVPTVTPTNSKFLWKNVTCDGIDGAFNVLVTVTLKENNSYWDIDVTNVKKTNSHGIWQVEFPKLSNIDVKKGNEVFVPIAGGILTDDFEKEGDFEQPYPYYGCAMQFVTVTKNNSTLYLCSEDLNGKHKIFSSKLASPNNMNFTITNNPAYMGMANHDYKQGYKFNMAVVKGDNYNACKKYRKWGVSNNFTPFSNGRFADRKDVPSWWNDLCVWILWTDYSRKPEDQKFNDWAREAVQYLDMTVGVHTYMWSKYIFDTHYPNFLPANEASLKEIEEMRKNNCIIMPYTNGHIVDRAQSDYYTQYGDTLLIEGQDGKTKKSEFQSFRTENMEACPGSVYLDCFHKEALDVCKTINPDALYIDQLGSKPVELCFSDEHRHPQGGGTFWADNLKGLINDLRKELNATREKPIILTTECSTEAISVDGWLACAEWGNNVVDTNSQMYVYSGYVSKFGTLFSKDEFKTEDALPAINKTAICLCRGYQLGWQICDEACGCNPLKEYPKFGEHLKNTSHARYAAKEYFNLGEMVRPVKFTSEIPTRKILFNDFTGCFEREYPTIRTCSYYYNGKTMVCITSVNPDSDTEVSFEAIVEDLNLQNKGTYTISEIYPEKKEISTGDKISATVKIEPLKTKILIIE